MAGVLTLLPAAGAAQETTGCNVAQQAATDSGRQAAPDNEAQARQGHRNSRARLDAIEKFLADSIDGRTEILEQIANMPNIEVGKGITFRPRNNSYEFSIRFRMQNMLGLNFSRDFGLTKTEAQVKRLRLRFDGYIFSPKFVYSIQLGFTGYDADPLPDGKMNFIRDAIIYYVPGPSWNIGFGQTKIKANRAAINSSGALQFIDRSIVNSEFNVDKDFGLFGEYNYGTFDRFALGTKASITLGEGRNYGSSSGSGLAYTGRLELYPFGRLHGKGEYTEGDTEYEENPKLMIGGSYSFNHKALRYRGQRGEILPAGMMRDIGSYFADIVFKYRGFAFCGDYMGRHLAGNSGGTLSDGTYIFTGSGFNLQTSYIWNRKWEVALRSSVIMPGGQTVRNAGYTLWNQNTLGLTRYIIGHSLKVQLDISYNYMKEAVLNPSYDRWGIRFQVELGL